MMQFGDVLSVQSERWRHYFPGLPNGVRVLQMKVKHPIPSFISIANEVCFVEHPNQIRTCRRCGRATHPKQNCVEANNPETITTTPSVTAILPSEQMFSDADFPPISIDLTQSDEVIETSANSKRTLPEQEAPKTVPTVAVDQAERHNTTGEDDNNDDDNDDDDEENDGSSSPCEASDGTYKRRLSTNRGKDKKKICCTLASQSVCDTVSFNISNMKDSNWPRKA
ncbi:hypothetical protein RP20_CCG015162 [Aedes albopictus]|nr:hypothetical protein RP20_CCG015162 [Aedes albopictus]